jgi:hypothetical protein
MQGKGNAQLEQQPQLLVLLCFNPLVASVQS